MVCVDACSRGDGMTGDCRHRYDSRSLANAKAPGTSKDPVGWGIDGYMRAYRVLADLCLPEIPLWTLQPARSLFR